MASVDIEIDGLSDLEEEIVSLRDDLSDLREVLNTLSDGVEELSRSNASLRETMDELTDALKLTAREAEVAQGSLVLTPIQNPYEQQRWEADNRGIGEFPAHRERREAYEPLKPKPFGLGEPRGDAQTWNKAAFTVAIDRKATTKFTYERPPGRFQPVWDAEREDRMFRPESMETIGSGLVEHTVVSGYDLLKQEPRNFRLDRIVGYVRVIED